MNRPPPEDMDITCLNPRCANSLGYRDEYCGICGTPTENWQIDFLLYQQKRRNKKHEIRNKWRRVYFKKYPLFLLLPFLLLVIINLFQGFLSKAAIQFSIIGMIVSIVIYFCIAVSIKESSIQKNLNKEIPPKYPEDFKK